MILQKVKSKSSNILRSFILIMKSKNNFLNKNLIEIENMFHQHPQKINFRLNFKSWTVKPIFESSIYYFICLWIHMWLQFLTELVFDHFSYSPEITHLKYSLSLPTVVVKNKIRKLVFVLNWIFAFQILFFFSFNLFMVCWIPFSI